ncbi:MAG: hypothetical protein HC906_06345 [Bacteroidales bacterium]|nr:hypothetical protein [Bacteroidales bacterium]
MWTPENPFLYELEVKTSGDNLTETFGLRSFAFDLSQQRALLNGKPYFLRGTNINLYRFFEDSARKDLPWDTVWVRSLFAKMKEMNWNSFRNCIGFPPEFWYDIADETGFLIQDEYPFWYLFEKTGNITVNQLEQEFSEWMEERWNHPSVVIWDAQNETKTHHTRLALERVRHKDLSNRPWENGWDAPGKSTDPVEAHPYFFFEFWKKPVDDEEIMRKFCQIPRNPFTVINEAAHTTERQRLKNPIIINEYGWLWLNRDGSPTTLTDQIYSSLFSDCKTSDERFEAYSRHLAMLTEYWRSHRNVAGVMHFCFLGYSRPNEPRGQTSDHFIDLKNLILELHFEKYVKQAFQPIGVMADYWKKEHRANEIISFPVILINDFDREISGELVISLKNKEKLISQLIPFQQRFHHWAELKFPLRLCYLIYRAQLKWKSDLFRKKIHKQAVLGFSGSINQNEEIDGVLPSYGVLFIKLSSDL